MSDEPQPLTAGRTRLRSQDDTPDYAPTDADAVAADLASAPDAVPVQVYYDPVGDRFPWGPATPVDLSAVDAAIDAVAGNLAAHVARVDNPHSVTATQVGAYSTTQVDAAIAGLSAAYSPLGHGHAIADTTGLQAALDGKQAAGSYAAASHSHTTSQLSDLGSWAGSASLTTLGTITAGTWQGTAVAVGHGGTGATTAANARANLAAAGTTAANLFTVAQTVGAGGGVTIDPTGFISIGATPATSGAIRLPNNAAIAARSVANNSNLDLLKLDTSNGAILSGAGCDLRVSSGGTSYLSHPAQFAIGETTGLGARLGVVSVNAGSKVCVLRGVASQSAPLLTLQGQSSTTAGRDLAKVDADFLESTDATRKGRHRRHAADSTGTDKETDRGWSDGTYGRFGMVLPPVAPTDADIPAGFVTPYLDATGDNLYFRVRKPDGSCFTAGPIPKVP